MDTMSPIYLIFSGPHDEEILTSMLFQPDGAANGYDDDSGGYSRGPRRPMRKDRDDKVHDSIIEERIQRERPCRTLFIRNIKASKFLVRVNAC